MPGHDIILIGGSAGSIPALLELVSGLPPDLPAAICIVIHVSPLSTTQLPTIISRKSSLPASVAEDGETIVPGHIYVAPPNYHLLVRDGKVELNLGPRENRVRPAIDPLFRSAARAYRQRAVGVVLSGTLGDGSTGLMVLKGYGGVTIVQDPAEAMFNSMPLNAMRYTEIDHVLPVAQIAPLLVRLVQENKQEEEGGSKVTTANIEEINPVIQQDLQEQEQNRRNGQIAVVSCPDCGGVLWQIDEGRVVRFQCHVGHAWTPDILLIQKTEELENALWSCVRMLTEKAILTRQRGTQVRQNGDEARANQIDEQAELDERNIKLIRDLILQASANPMNETLKVEEILQEEGDSPASEPAT